jgi:hypothetical protein
MFSFDVIHHFARTAIRKRPFPVGHPLIANTDWALSLLAEKRERLKIWWFFLNRF